MSLDDYIRIAAWAIPIVMLPILAGRHNPTAALAWLIFFFFQPWAGLIAYFLFSENRVLRRLTKTYCQRISEIRSLHHLASRKPDIFRSPATGISVLHLDKITEKLVCMPAVGGNSAEPLDDGNETIDRLVSDIDAATHHVHLLFYIFQDDRIGRRVADAMARAVGRGVRARLIVDAFGSRSLNRSLGERMIREGIELHWLMSINPLRRQHTRLDLRNHRKLVIIDGKIAYTGSQNIEDRDYDHGRPEAWHDIMLRITGPAVLQLQLVFLEDWYLATEDILEDHALFPAPETDGDLPIQVVPSGPSEPTTALRDILITAVGAAQESVIITTPYFIPDEPFRIALCLASLRGVRIDLLIPKTTDHLLLGPVARGYFQTLFDCGVNIHLHRGMLHSKTMTVDSLVATVGTANFDRRSFFLHSELSLLLYGKEFINRLRAKQMEYLEQSFALDPVQWKRRSPLKRMRDNVLKLLSPVL